MSNYRKRLQNHKNVILREKQYFYGTNLQVFCLDCRGYIPWNVTAVQSVSSIPDNLVIIDYKSCYANNYKDRPAEKEMLLLCSIYYYYNIVLLLVDNPPRAKQMHRHSVSACIKYLHLRLDMMWHCVVH